MNAKDVQDMFKFYRRQDANGLERIYMFPEDVIQLDHRLHPDVGDVADRLFGAPPTGRYITRRSNLDCVAYLTGDCSAPETVIVTGPWFGRSDFSFVKRFSMGRSRFIEARMDLYNVFDNINFSVGTVTRSGSTTEQVGSDSGGPRRQRVAGCRRPHHQFGLRFTW